jgi:phage terminase large subunit-like protein
VVVASGEAAPAVNALELANASGKRAERNPLDYARLTVPQRLFASAMEREALWRDPNQVGKSFALAWDCHHRCRGTHPYLHVRRPPINVLVIGTSFDQMIPLMRKLWELAPKHELDPSNGYEPGRGITGKPPRLVYASGPGKGSVISFATYAAGASRVAGDTLDLVMLDEPPPEEMLGELRPRLLRRRGSLRVAFTPVPDMPDQTWLRKMVIPRGQPMKPGHIREYHNGLISPEHLHPEGYPFPWLDQEDLDNYIAGLLGHERAMRSEGAWDQIVTGRWLTNFTAERNVRHVTLRELVGWDLRVGLDHGTPGDGRQAAVLLATKDTGTLRPKAVWLDECVNEGFTQPEHDAKGILDMLARNGLTYDNVDHWVGDVPTSSEAFQVIKSNREIRRWMAIHLGRPEAKLKPIPTPDKHKSSLSDGMRLMNTIFGRQDEDGRPDGIVRPCCPWFIKGCEVFDGNLKHPLKDVLDGGRYPLEKAVTQPVAVLNARY